MTTQLSGQFDLFTATEGSTLPSNTDVAAFNDPNLTDTASDFSATITWGDGNTSTGTVVGSNGSFTVEGSNTYASEGFFNASATITGAGDSPLTLGGTIAVTGDDQLTGFGGPIITASPNQPLNNVTVATFSDTDTFTPASDFTTQVDWGDGTQTSGTLTGSHGSFTVTGSHTYTTAGDYIITTFMDDIIPDLANGQATTQADIGFGGNETFNTAIATIAIPSGTTVANFVDNAGDPSTDYTASVNWGDGTITNGAIVTGSNGQFAVATPSVHTYAAFGDFTLTVTVTNTANNNATAVMSGTVAVASDDDFNSITADAINGSPNQPLTNVTVASFTDTNTVTTPNELVATIVWGDGTSSAGTIMGGGGNFTVQGTHTYTQPGQDILTVEVADAPADGQGTASTEASSTATIGLVAGTATPIAVPEGTPTGGQIASFIDGNLSDTAGSFGAMIDWGDGTAPTSGIVSGSNGSFNVSGGLHEYTDEGLYKITTTVTKSSDSEQVSITGNASISDADNFAVTADNFVGNPGQTLTNIQVASFTDSYGGQVPSDLTATVSWGDGTSSMGTISGGGGNFVVDGSHTYTTGGLYTTTVTVADDPPGTAMVSGSTTSTINLAGTVTLTSAIEDVALPSSTQVATFTDNNLADTAGSFTSTINWGDGNTTTGTVTGSAGTFAVDGGHTYTIGGNEQVSVTLTRTADQAQSTVSGTVVMSLPPPPTVTAAAPNVAASASESFAAAALFSASDADNAAILGYAVEDQTVGASQGFWVLNGQVLPNGQVTTLSAAQLSELTFVAGSASTPVSDMLDVAASDAGGFGAPATFTVTSAAHVSTAPPTVTAANELEAPSLTLAASSLFSATASGGNSVVSYEVEDTTSDSGHWVFNGVAEPANQLVLVSAAQLSQLSFVTGYGSDTLMVRPNDGSQWGNYTTFTVAPPPNAAPPAGTADTLVTLRNADGAFEFYDIGHNAILLAGPLGQINPALQVAGVGGFDGSDTADLLMRDPTTGAFTLYDVSNNNITGNVSIGQVGLEWTVSGFGDFSARPGETDMLMRDSSTGAFEIYDISNNAITHSTGMGQVGLEWQVGGFGDFSGRANETDMLIRNSNTGVFEIYDISNNAITSSVGMGQVGFEWQVAGFGDFSTRSGETDMLMRNSNTGAFEVYDIGNNTITSATGMGQVGLEWTIAGFGDFSDTPNETDMLMRNSQTGAFQLFDIRNNTVTSVTPMGQVGLEWSISGVSRSPAAGPPSTQLSGPAVEPGAAPSSASDQLTQAMAAFAPSGMSGASSTIGQTTPPSAIGANPLTTPNHA
jgi:hypothetical protein